MNEKQGTPKSLTEAIQNGKPSLTDAEIESIAKNIQDYLAHKFMLAMFEDVEDEVNFRQLFIKCIQRKE